MRVKFSYILFIFLQSIFFANSQNYTLYPNINPSIKLQQKIDNNQLILSDRSHINKVNFYNRTTTELVSYKNDSKSISIPLDKLESSYYSIMVHNDKNNIIMLGVDVLNTLSSDDSLVAVEIKKEKTKTKKITKPEIKIYWAIREIKKHSGSTLSSYYYYNLDLMERAIKKNKSDLKSFSGKDNTLTIYEVYNKRDFTRVKNKLVQSYRSSKELVLSKKERNAFNIIPFYRSSSENTELSRTLK